MLAEDRQKERLLRGVSLWVVDIANVSQGDESVISLVNEFPDHIEFIISDRNLIDSVEGFKFISINLTVTIGVNEGE